MKQKPASLQRELKLTHADHEFPPLFDKDSEVLILGSFPTPRSRHQALYYEPPQNRFFRVLAAVLKEPLPLTVEEKRSMLLRHHIALWDTIESCDICGASDASIRNAVPTDLPWLLRNTRIRKIFTTGATAQTYYEKLHYPCTKIHAIRLPSTSPANCAVSLETLTERYQAISEALSEDSGNR